jgi:invasion protein IalB
MTVQFMKRHIILGSLFTPLCLALLSAVFFSILQMQTVAAQATPASAKVGDHFGDWVFECAAIGEGQTLCSLTQILMAKENNQAIARFSFSRDKKTNGIIFGALVPLGLDIQAGVSASFDQRPPVSMTVLTCTQAGCIANAVIDPATFEAIKSGKTLAVSIKFRGADKPAVLSGSLNGLGAGAIAAGIK